jgi:hypothetical protein
MTAQQRHSTWCLLLLGCCWPQPQPLTAAAPCPATTTTTTPAAAAAAALPVAAAGSRRSTQCRKQAHPTHSSNGDIGSHTLLLGATAPAAAAGAGGGCWTLQLLQLLHLLLLLLPLLLVEVPPSGTKLEGWLLQLLLLLQGQGVCCVRPAP